MGHPDPLHDYLVRITEKVPKQSAIRFLPFFYEVLNRLILQDYEAVDKQYVCGAIAYIATPNDRIPDEKHGLTGLLDDLYVCCFVLEHLVEKHGKERFSAYWDYSGYTLRGAIKAGLEQTKPLWSNERLRKTILESVGLYKKPEKAKATEEASKKAGAKTKKKPVSAQKQKPTSKYATTTPQKDSKKTTS